MRWKHKALIQRLVAKLPPSPSYRTYYAIQRHFGALRQTDPLSRLLAGVNIVNLIRAQGRMMDQKTVLEIGTGNTINLPIALWLCGAENIITVDLNPYLAAELVLEQVQYIREHPQEVVTLFGIYTESPSFNERFKRLLQTRLELQNLLDTMSIQYFAPADAGNLNLPKYSIDYHISNLVFEHISPKVIARILLEGKRLVRDNGLFVHLIDTSDHFSKSDRTISAINFLRFSDHEWMHYAGNRYMYHNRLRVNNFVQLFHDVGLHITTVKSIVDQRALDELRQGFPLDPQYQQNDDTINATTSIQIVASP